uniref:Uncharacterized protein n=1 Tax=Panagrolaimus sp. JU765 TaxID=591449 RepID=A0AC34RQQ0_9BILA
MTKSNVGSINGLFIVDECIEFKVTHAFDPLKNYVKDPKSYINFVISDVQINFIVQLDTAQGSRYLVYNGNEHECAERESHSVKICGKNVIVKTDAPTKTSTWKLKNELKSESRNNKKVFRFTLSGKLHPKHPTINWEFAKGIYGREVVTTTTKPKTTTTESTTTTETTTISQEATSPEQFSKILSSTIESERKPIFAVSTSNHALQILIVLFIVFI